MTVAGTPLASLLETKRILITVGAGGVGKTTTAAALAVAAAQRGRRVLCLTIDPAKRLAESLGIGEMRREAQLVPEAAFAAAGIRATGSLTAMMLDTKQTFDELVRKYSSSTTKADALLNNRLYQYMSTSLAGTQEYMAMEKLIAVKDDPAYDLIVLDTPPTANALDFLDAPERLIDALDSAAMRWFGEAFESSGRFSLNVLAKSAAGALRAVGSITGGGFLEAMAGLISELNELFGGFKQRASLVQKALRDDGVSFILVTSPSPMSIREVGYFSERLVEHRMPRGAFIVNRVHYASNADERAVAGVDAYLREHPELVPGGEGADIAMRIRTAQVDSEKLAALDAMHLRALEPHVGTGIAVVTVPALATDVHDVRLLAEVGRVLTGDVAA